MNIGGPLTQIAGSVGKGIAIFQCAVIQVSLRTPGSKNALVVSGDALLDAGAHMCAIGEDVAEDLGLALEDKINIETLHRSASVRRTTVEYAIAGCGFVTAEVLVGDIPVDLTMVIGTQVLSHCVFKYDGPSNEFTLRWDD